MHTNKCHPCPPAGPGNSYSASDLRSLKSRYCLGAKECCRTTYFCSPEVSITHVLATKSQWNYPLDFELLQKKSVTLSSTTLFGSVIKSLISNCLFKDVNALTFTSRVLIGLLFNVVEQNMKIS